MYAWVEWGRERERERESLAEFAHKQGRTVRFFYETSLPFFFVLLELKIFLVIKYSGCQRKFSWSHLLQTAVYTLHVNTPPSLMSSTKCTWSCFLIACYPRNLRNTGVLFTLGNRCISCYFVPSVRLPSSMPPTQFTRHVKGISKSISNNTLIAYLQRCKTPPPTQGMSWIWR